MQLPTREQALLSEQRRQRRARRQGMPRRLRRSGRSMPAPARTGRGGPAAAAPPRSRAATLQIDPVGPAPSCALARDSQHCHPSLLAPILQPNLPDAPRHACVGANPRPSRFHSIPQASHRPPKSNPSTCCRRRCCCAGLLARCSCPSSGPNPFARLSCSSRCPLPHSSPLPISAVAPLYARHLLPPALT